MSAAVVYHYHIYSDIPGDSHMSTSHDAGAHADSSRDIAIPIKSNNELINLFQGWIRSGEKIQSLDFHTHGNSGLIALGNDVLTISTLVRFTGRNFDNLWLPNAKITFLGCNVADGPGGEGFLAAVGQVFLKRSGGTVKGNTASGLGDPFGWLSPSRVYFLPTGDWVTAHVSPGGAVVLEGHRWLHPAPLRELAARLEIIVEHNKHKKYTADLEKYLNGAWAFLGRKQTDRPSYPDIALAFEYLQRVADQIKLWPDEDRRVPQPPIYPTVELRAFH